MIWDIKNSNVWDLVQDYADLYTRIRSGFFRRSPGAQEVNDMQLIEQEIKSRICECGKSIKEPSAVLFLNILNDFIRQTDITKANVKSIIDKLSTKGE